MSIEEIRGFLEEQESAGRSVGVALLISTWRSAPRLPGARFAASPAGSAAGSISAGCVEADLRERIASMLDRGMPELVRYGVSDEDATAVGLSCGGEIEVLLLPHVSGDPVWREIEGTLDRGETAILATATSGPALGRRILFTSGGAQIGSLGSADLDAAVQAAVKRSESTGRRARRERIGDDVEVLVEWILPRRRLVVVGATRIGLALARLALAIELPVTIIEPRDVLADQAESLGARVLREWPEDVMRDDLSGRGVAVAVVAHDERLDLPALAAALETGADYVGLLGGGRTQAQRRAALEARGIAFETIGTIRGPIGLDICAETPSEIAVSILAEIIRHWNCRASGAES